ncbi:MAG: nucleotidyltransferase family protein [Bacteroidales bacterium]
MQSILSILSAENDPAWLKKRHGLSYQQIRELTGLMPDKKIQQEQVLKMAQLRIFLNTVRQLEQNGIWFVLFKGPALSQKLYNDPIYRHYKDMDILIKPADLANAMNVFRENEYQPLQYGFPEDVKKQQRVIRYRWQLPLVHRKTQSKVEIHWRIMDVMTVSQSKVQKIVEQEIVSENLWGRSFWQFSPELELLYLIIHGAKHAWFRLKWLTDVHRIATHCPPEPKRFLRLSQTLNAHRMVNQANRLMMETFADAQPLPAIKRDVEKITCFAREKLLEKQEPVLPGASAPPLKQRLRFKCYLLNLAPDLEYKTRFVNVALSRWIFNQFAVNH